MDFVTPRNRDAWAAIHGFVVQVQLTIRRWLNLPAGRELQLERGEDIDEVVRLAAGKEWRRLEQVKFRGTSVTLRTPVALEAIANFAEHRLANCGHDVVFRFTTNARRGVEKRRLFSGGRRGIDVW